MYIRANKAPYRMTFSLPRLADVATLKHATAALVEHMSSTIITTSLTAPPPPTTTATTAALAQQQQVLPIHQVVVQQQPPLQLEHVYTVDSTYYSPESKKVFLSETITDEYVIATMYILYIRSSLYTLLLFIPLLYIMHSIYML